MSLSRDVAAVVRAGYGKLPISREYIRLDCDGGPARWFRDWIDKAASLLEGEPDPTRPALRLLTVVPGTERLVVASIWPSSDEGGRRRFPFSFYHLVEASRLEAAAGCLWSALDALTDEQAALFAEAGERSESTGLSERMGNAARPSGMPHTGADAANRQRSAAEAIPLCAWFEELFGDLDQPAGPMALWRLQHVLRAARGSLASLGQDCPGVRLPLAPSWPFSVQADAWLSLLAGPTGVLSCAPHMLLGQLGAKPGMALWFRPVEPRDAGLFAGRPVRGMVDLASDREPADLRGFDTFAAEIRRRVERPDASLASLSTLLEEIPT
jgi:hypothetical protein